MGVLQKIGGAISDLNPMKAAKVDKVSAPHIVSPNDISGPKGPENAPTPIGAIAGPTAATLNMMPQNAFRDQQMNLATQLAQQASGQGPSIAENQLRQGQEANIAAQYAAANSARGGANPGIARQAMQQGAEIQGQLAQQAATARMQEQNQAQALLGQVSGQARGMDLQAANAQAQLNQQASLAGFQGQLQTQQLNAQMQQQFAALQAQYAAMGLDAQKANQQAALQVQQLQQQGILGAAGINQQATAAAQSSRNQLIGSVLGAAGTAIGAYGALGGAAANAGAGAGNSAPGTAMDGTSGAIGPLTNAGAYAGTPAGYAIQNDQFPQYYSQNYTQPWAMSDRTVKTDIKDGKESLRDFLDALTVNDYRYKDESNGKGRFVSVMAQDLEKTDLGKNMVVETEQGKAVDYGKGFGAMLAAQADLHKRLSKLEKKK